MGLKTPAPGKLSADGLDYGRTRIKRAHSNVISLVASAGTKVGLVYTTTKILITSVKLYRITETVGTLCTVDVGVNGGADDIVAAQAVAAAAIDTVLDCTIANGEVAAGKMITAAIKHVAGTGGTATFAIEYYEDI